MTDGDIVRAVASGDRTVARIAAVGHVSQWSADLRADLERLRRSGVIVSRNGWQFEVAVAR